MDATWNLPAPPGFQGLDPHKPVTAYFRHLPHWRQDGATYFITFRLIDSLPQNKLNELKAIRREWEAGHGNLMRVVESSMSSQTDEIAKSKAGLEELAKKIMSRVERWLDEGYGTCSLRELPAQAELVESLRYFDGERYELGSYVIMPNHVHAVVRPLFPDEWPLEKILQSWKRFTSRKINQALGSDGPLWQEESFDRIIRDEEHLFRCIQYIGGNPHKAQLNPHEFRLWIRPAWEALGWKFQSA